MKFNQARWLQAGFFATGRIRADRLAILPAVAMSAFVQDCGTCIHGTFRLLSLMDKRERSHFDGDERRPLCGRRGLLPAIRGLHACLEFQIPGEAISGIFRLPPRQTRCVTRSDFWALLPRY